MQYDHSMPMTLSSSCRSSCLVFDRSRTWLGHGQTLHTEAFGHNSLSKAKGYGQSCLSGPRHRSGGLSQGQDPR